MKTHGLCLLPTSARGRDGAVLVVVVLLGLGMFALAHGLLLGARSALVTSRAGAKLEEARVVADEAMDRAVTSGPGPLRDSLAIGESRAHPDTVPSGYHVVIRWRRLSAEIWLVEIDGEVEGRTVATVARVVWTLDPLTRLGALPATVSVGADAPVSVAGSLGSPELAEERELESGRGMDGSCTPWWEAWPDSVTDVVHLSVVADSGLGPLSLPLLLSATVTPDRMSATPAPRITGGICDTGDEWNWGDPTTSGSPCSTHFVLVGGSGLLRMVGGEGQGVLVVDGDVELTESAHFFGLIVTSGMLRLGSGAVLEGFAMALGGVQIMPDAELRRSVCRGLLALHGVRDRLAPSLPLQGALDYGPR